MENSSAYASDPRPDTPNALCFGAEFPATGAPCHVKIDSSGIRIYWTDPSLSTGEQTVSFNGLSISSGGLNHDQLVVKWGAETDGKTLYIRDPTLIRAF